MSGPRRAKAIATTPADPEFKRLDASVPLLLLPVRLETVFATTAPAAAGAKAPRDARPRELLIRVFPDDVHVDRHVRALSAVETNLGQRFWRTVWNRDRTHQEAAFTRLADRLGALRAGWVLEATRPLNWERRGDSRRASEPRFGAPRAAAGGPGKARLLPDRWIVTGYQNNELVFSRAGRAIRRDLAITPDFASGGAAAPSIAALMTAQGLEWLRDFAAAEAAGMAIRVPLGGSWRPALGMDIFCVGVRTTEAPDAAARAFADLLAAHHWTRGLDFVPRGTPTNNSDRAYSGVSLSVPDTRAILDSVLARPAAVPAGGDVDRRFDTSMSHALGFEPGSILERTPHRDDPQLEIAEAMSAALWPATWGRFLRTMIVGAVDDATIGWLRKHFISRVKGGGALPAIRIGAQPYGVLPVAAQAARAEATRRIDKLETLLVDLVPAWQDAVDGRVARLDVEAGDSAGGAADATALDEATRTLARVLGATPNPSGLMLTAVTDQTDVYELRWVLFAFLLDLAISPEFPDIASALGSELAAARTLEDQIAAFEALVNNGDASTPDPAGALWLAAHATGYTTDQREAAQKAIDLIEDYVLPLLFNHQDRAAPILDRGPDRGAVTGLMADDGDPPLFFSLFGASETRLPVTAPLVADAQASRESVRAWLDALAIQAADPTRPASAPGEHPPLLFQMLQRAIAVVHDDDRDDLLAGIETLATAFADGRLADPIGTLETLMGEVLGTCMHRLDAWLSAGAIDQLDEARKGKPRGLTLGGFGWVLGLEPSSTVSPSQGFIHAPSLDHAATAAILRSGWSALGDGALGVDVSSSRMRGAAWIVDGVRDGYRLGELLGQSLERRLHEARLDRWVEPIRSAVLAGTGASDEAPVAIVDGFLVARAWIGGDDVAPLTAEESAVRAQMRSVVAGAAGDAARLTTALDLHAAEFDSVADASLFGAVHAIVRGNPDRAAATLGAAGGTAGTPPPLTAMRTTRGGQRIAHRVLLLLDPAAGVAAATSPHAQAEPALEAWLAAALPVERIGYGVWVEEDGKSLWQGPYPLSSAGIGALELLATLPTGGAATLGTSLARRLAWRAEREAAALGRVSRARIDADLAGGDGGALLPLSLALAALQALRGLVHGARALNDSDLATETLPSTADTGIIGSRADDLIDAARDAAQGLDAALASGEPAALLDACAALAGWEIAGAIPKAGLRALAASADTEADRAALITEAQAVRARLQTRLDAHDAVVGNDLAASLARIRALLPGAIVLPPITPVAIASLRDSAARSQARLGAPEAAIPWLQQMGRVRANLTAAGASIDLVDAAIGASPFRPTLVQFPDNAGEGWAAQAPPTPDGAPRTCILSLTAVPAGSKLAGLVLDAWSEVIPDTRTTSGIAVHFDAPSARAPQTWLLAVPPAEKRWSHDAVLTLVRQTLDRARQRAVGPEEIEGFGQYLPATYLADATDPGPALAERAP